VWKIGASLLKGATECAPTWCEGRRLRPDPSGLAQILIGLGIVAILVGVLVWTGAFRWFGRLPGDVRIERDNVHVYVPIVSMLLLSVVATLILRIFRR